MPQVVCWVLTNFIIYFSPCEVVVPHLRFDLILLFKTCPLPFPFPSSLHPSLGMGGMRLGSLWAQMERSGC